MTKKIDEIIRELEELRLEDRDSELIILLEDNKQYEKYSYDEKIKIFKEVCSPTDFKNFARFLEEIAPHLYAACIDLHKISWPKTLICDNYHIAFTFAAIIRIVFSPCDQCSDEIDKKIINAMTKTLKL